MRLSTGLRHDLICVLVQQPFNVFAFHLGVFFKVLFTDKSNPSGLNFILFFQTLSFVLELLLFQRFSINSYLYFSNSIFKAVVKIIAGFLFSSFWVIIGMLFFTFPFYFYFLELFSKEFFLG